jgi:hypothetical protein
MLTPRPSAKPNALHSPSPNLFSLFRLALFLSLLFSTPARELTDELINVVPRHVPLDVDPQAMPMLRDHQGHSKMFRQLNHRPAAAALPEPAREPDGNGLAGLKISLVIDAFHGTPVKPKSRQADRRDRFGLKIFKRRLYPAALSEQAGIFILQIRFALVRRTVVDS